MTIDLFKDTACAKCKYAQLRQDRNNVLQSVHVCTRPNSERVKTLKYPRLANIAILIDMLEQGVKDNDRFRFHSTRNELEHQLFLTLELLHKMSMQCERGWTSPENGYMLYCAFMEPKEDPKRSVYYPPSWKGKKKRENPDNGTAEGSREVRPDEG